MIDLPKGVADCALSENLQTCTVCAGKGWYTKITSDNVNPIQVCLDQGYSGTITEYGVNTRRQCEYSNVQNGLGPDLHHFGFHVSWNCGGNI